MEAKYHFYNFSEIRIRAEKIARENANYQEVTLSDIYHVFSTESSIEEEEWIKRELETEMEIRFANSYMLDVFKELKKETKKLLLFQICIFQHNIFKQYFKGKDIKDLIIFLCRAMRNEENMKEKFLRVLANIISGKKIIQ